VDDVVVIDLAPGITAARLRALLTPLPEAVVLRAFGVGNVPSAEPGLADVIAEVIGANVAIARRAAEICSSDWTLNCRGSDPKLSWLGGGLGVHGARWQSQAFMLVVLGVIVAVIIPAA